MDTQELIETTRTLVAGDKGQLAMEESNATCRDDLPGWVNSQTEKAG